MAEQLTDSNLKEKIQGALRSVYDPEIPVDIYELGLIYEINIFPINNIHILMTLTSPACPSVFSFPKRPKWYLLSMPPMLWAL